MDGRRATERPPAASWLPGWALGLIALALIVTSVGVLALFGDRGLDDRNGLHITERVALRSGEIKLTVRNDRPNPVAIAQVSVNRAYVAFSAASKAVGSFGSTEIDIAYPWIEGQAYEIFLLTSTGGTVEHTISSAETLE